MALWSSSLFDCISKYRSSHAFPTPFSSQISFFSLSPEDHPCHFLEKNSISFSSSNKLKLYTKYLYSEMPLNRRNRDFHVIENSPNSNIEVLLRYTTTLDNLPSNFHFGEIVLTLFNLFLVITKIFYKLTFLLFLPTLLKISTSLS